MNSSLFLIIGGLVAGLTVFAALFFMMRSKLGTITKNYQHELQNVRYETTTRLARLELSDYQRILGNEEVIYDSNKGNLQEDLSGRGANAWDYAGHRFSKQQGKGTHIIQNQVISINRTNTTGRYELQLKKYGYNNGTDRIVADNTIEVRRMRVSCEVKTGNGSHILRFVFKGEASQNVLDEKDYVVFSPEWEKVDLVFTIRADEDSYLRIDDLSVLNAPSSIKIRNLILLEKTRRN